MPTSAPTGIAESSDGTARSSSAAPAPAGAAACRARLVVDDRLLRLARHARLVRPGGDVAVRRPPPPLVELAVERRRRQLRARPRDARPREREPELRPRDATRSPARPRAAPRTAPARPRPLGTVPDCQATFPSASRENSSRVSAALRLSNEPAHHTTAWCFARVSATYASRRSSPRCSSVCLRTLPCHCGPSSPTSIVRLPRSSWNTTGVRRSSFGAGDGSNRSG